MTCYFTQQVKENMMAKISKQKLEATHDHPKYIHHHKYRQVQANKVDK